jgi:hypothetical protein
MMTREMTNKRKIIRNNIVIKERLLRIVLRSIIRSSVSTVERMVTMLVNAISPARYKL